MHLHTMGATVVSDKMYFTSFDFNALFCMDLKDGHIEYKTYFAEYEKYRKELYAKQIMHNGKIYFIPRSCGKIAIFDIDTEEMNYIEIKEKQDGPIRDAFIGGDYLWMLYANYPAYVLKVNLKTGRYDVINIDWNKVEEEIGYSERTMSSREKCFAFRHAQQVGQLWWMFAEENGYLLIYDWRKNLYKTQSFSYFKNQETIGNVNEKMWMVARNGSRLLEYNYKNQEEKWIELPELKQLPGNNLMIAEQDKYMLFVKQTGMLVVNKDSYESKCFMFTEKKNLMSYLVYEKKVILFPAQGKGLIIFYLEENRIEECKFEWEEKVTNISLEEYFSGCLSECMCELGEFMALEPEKKEKAYQDKGKKIWQNLCKK